MKNLEKIIITMVLITMAILGLFAMPGKLFADNSSTNFWSIRSIDTMKYSRDAAGQQLTNPKLQAVMEKQMSDIASTGANYVAVGTPYDEKFIPVLKAWVTAARQNNLHVWFRGNFSSWEGWFNYPKKLTRAQHIQLTQNFILNHPDLFQDGDIFMACPECENGGVGDPRHTGDVAGFRQFLIDENQTAQSAFNQIHKQVASNYFSMNGDVAKLIMDKDTTSKLGGIVVIDHYVSSVDKMTQDINSLANTSGGKIILGEFGAPIPDLNGNFTDEQQKNWMQQTLDRLAQNKNVIGLNYWVSVGGSTQIWTESGAKKPAVDVLTKYYKPTLVTGHVVNALSQAVSNAQIAGAYVEVQTNSTGEFTIPVVMDQNSSLKISAPNFTDQVVNMTNLNQPIVLQKTHESLWFKLLKLFLRGKAT